MTLNSLVFRLAALLFWAALSAHGVYATTAIIVDWNITAGTNETIKIDQRLASDSHLRKEYDAYRVYLALTPPGWGTGPVCWLVKGVPLDTTNVTFEIPRDVAPDNSNIRISTSLFKVGSSKGTSGFSYSSNTRLLNANGNWSQRELDGWQISDQDAVSCAAFGCVRKCNEKYYTGDKTRYSNGTESDKQTNDCVDACTKEYNPTNAASPSLAPMLSVLMGAVALAAFNLG